MVPQTGEQLGASAARASHASPYATCVNGKAGSEKRNRAVAIFLGCLVAVTVLRALWFGMTLGDFAVAIVLYAAVWAAALTVDHFVRRRRAGA